MTDKRGPGRPPSADPAKRRCFRMTDHDWEKLQRRAEREDMTVTDYIKTKTIG